MILSHTSLSLSTHHTLALPPSTHAAAPISLSTKRAPAPVKPAASSSASAASLDDMDFDQMAAQAAAQPKPVASASAAAPSVDEITVVRPKKSNSILRPQRCDFQNMTCLPV